MRPHPVPERVPRGLLMYAVRLQPNWTQAEILFSDDHWRQATVVAWCRYGRTWAALVRWADGTEDWLVYNARHIQRSFEHLGGRSEA